MKNIFPKKIQQRLFLRKFLYLMILQIYLLDYEFQTE